MMKYQFKNGISTFIEEYFDLVSDHSAVIFTLGENITNRKYSLTITSAS